MMKNNRRVQHYRCLDNIHRTAAGLCSPQDSLMVVGVEMVLKSQVVRTMLWMVVTDSVVETIMEVEVVVTRAMLDMETVVVDLAYVTEAVAIGKALVKVKELM